MVDRGVNFKQYYEVLKSIEYNDQMSAGEKRAQREKVFDLLHKDLEANYLGGHIYREDIEQVQRRDYLCKLKIHYYPTCNPRGETMYLTFLHDCYSFMGMYMKY